MKFTKTNNGIVVSNIFSENDGIEIEVYKTAGYRYLFNAGKIGIGYAYLEAESETEACKKIAELINKRLDELYLLLQKREESKSEKFYIPLMETKLEEV